MNNFRNILTSFAFHDPNFDLKSSSAPIGLPMVDDGNRIISIWSALVIADFGSYIRVRAISNSEQEPITRVIQINKEFIRRHSKSHNIPTVGTRFMWTFFKDSENRLNSTININRSLESFLSQIQKKKGYLESNEEIIGFLYSDDE